MMLLQSGTYYPDGHSLALVNSYQVYNIVTILCEHMRGIHQVQEQQVLSFARLCSSLITSACLLVSACLCSSWLIPPCLCSALLWSALLCNN